MIREIEHSTGKPIDLLDIKVVPRPEPDIRRVSTVQNGPSRGASGPRPRYEKSGGGGDRARMPRSLPGARMDGGRPRSKAQ